jgi:hypothetical protein
MDGDGLAANPLQMQPEMAARRRPKRRQGGLGRPFPKGMSGNPMGKRPGTRNRATLIAEAMLDCETRPLLRQTIDEAKGGDPVMMRFCIGRILPPRRDRPVRFALPPVRSPADLSAALEAVTAAVANGELTIREAWEFSQMIDNFIRTIDASEFARQLERLEAAADARQS